MDATETWLVENDPRYADSSHAWRHVKSAPAGKCRGPREEIPCGSSSSVLGHVTESRKPVEHGAVEDPSKICRVCKRGFEPREAKNDLCSAFCRAHARREYQRDLMRVRRAA